MRLRLCWLVSCLLLAGCATGGRFASTPMMPLPASDSRILYEGRFDRANPAQPVFIWAGSRIRLDFEGPALAVEFGPATGQNFFNVTVDGVNETVGILEGQGRRFVWPHALEAGRHRLEIFKRSEADAGHAVFAGVQLADGAQVWAPAAPAYKLKMEFLGDSITVGANNEDGAVDQWEDRRTHNHALSYGHLVSQELGADHRAVAVSGMGICEGFVEMRAGAVWDKIYPRANAPRADLAAWQPDIVFVNFGENDSAFPRANGRPFPTGFTAGYVALIKALRAAYPDAQIVLLRGGMWGGANDPDLREAWTAAVRELEASDPRISHYVFQHWSEQHPRVSDHRILAAELVAWLKAQPFMRALGQSTK
jgi:lysophospholipase L1-like esterase